MNETVLPQPNLNNEAVQWSRELNRRTRDTSRELSRLSQNLLMTNRANAGQMGVIGRQLDQIIATQEALQVQQGQIAAQQAETAQVVERLQDAGRIMSNQSADTVTGAVWYPNPPSVTMSSLSGRFRVSVFGTAAGATSFFSFSAPGYPRDRIVGGSAAAMVSRVSGFGGASSLGTVYGSWIATLSPGVNHVFTAQALGTTASSTAAGLGIQVEPVL